MLSCVSQLSEAHKLLLREYRREGKLLSGRRIALQTRNQFKLVFCTVFSAVLHPPRGRSLLGMGVGHEAQVSVPRDPGFVISADSWEKKKS